MSDMQTVPGAWRRGAIVFGLLLAWAASGFAQVADMPGRVARLSDLRGSVWVFDIEQGQWVEGLRNHALTSGDRLSIDRDGRAEVRIGSTDLRLAGGTEIEFERMDDDRMVFALQAGSLALRVRSREIAQEVEVLTREGRLWPERSGHFRVDRIDDTTYVAAWRGSMRFEASDQQVSIPEGRRAEFFRQMPDRATVVSWSAPASDAFADWVDQAERRDSRSASQRYVSPEMTGAEDLDRHGRWERHPEYGMVWSPLSVAAGWAPFRDGRWTWHVRWGWTWVDAAPWGFAPSHYGRWVSWRGRWFWSPGPRVARPAFAPALVSWSGNPNVNVTVTLGGYRAPPVQWVPLAPGAVYVPYRPLPVHPPAHAPGHQHVPAQRPWAPRPVQQALPASPVPLTRPIEPVQRPDPLPRPVASPRPAVIHVPGGAEPSSPPQAVPPKVSQVAPVAKEDRGGKGDRGERGDRVERGERGERNARGPREDKGPEGEPARARAEDPARAGRPRDQRERQSTQ